MHKSTKACDIPMSVKKRVYERDNGECIFCGFNGLPEAHYIPRSQLGLGIEENIVTLCRECHRKFDNSTNRKWMQPIIKEYLQSKYPDWDESKLTYKKYAWDKGLQKNQFIKEEQQ